ncbi:PAQR family membrane homeostasis protein TrhA [Kocuria tytonis]|uniref:Hemolysin III family protein n=1 Tax=Kocuria tytonis TaxID=2054280 RepID=A0A495A3M1_9MICC|nr:hemolysin III family protein [Kocuria tytonis]RKQ34126.1 hemolysin III family protein [Kocuria tytonis]
MRDDRATKPPAPAPLTVVRHTRNGPLTVEKKPSWRGWIHAGFSPFAIAMGVVAVAVAPTGQLRLACLVYTVTAIMLFGTSAVYHRFYWGARMNAVLRRLDHSNIALIIAGTYTPLAVSFLPGDRAALLLGVIWTLGALLVVFRVFWLGAPRWLYTPLYIVMGCLALLYLPAFFAVNVPATVLLISGGAAYIAGALCYALKRPRLLPATFSFHEVFHACTIIGFVCHYISIMLAMFAS